MAECGAKLRKRDARCHKPAMANGRCRLHGGLSTGAKNPHSQRRHGIYDDVLSEEDKAFLESVKCGQVDDELDVMRVQLRRALKLKGQFEKNPCDPALAHLVKVNRERRPVMINGVQARDDTGAFVFEMVEVSRELAIPNLEDRIYRWSTRIESLERTRKELGGGGDKPDEAARKIKEALDEIEGTVPDADA